MKIDDVVKPSASVKPHNRGGCSRGRVPVALALASGGDEFQRHLILEHSHLLCVNRIDAHSILYQGEGEGLARQHEHQRLARGVDVQFDLEGFDWQAGRLFVPSIRLMVVVERMQLPISREENGYTLSWAPTLGTIG